MGWLSTTNVTTIEFCEKHLKKAELPGGISRYSQGVCANFREVCFPGSGLQYQARGPFNELKILRMDGYETTFSDVSPDELVLVLKIRLEEQTGIPRNNQRLLRNNRILADFHTLWDCGVTESSETLSLVICTTA